MEFQVLDGAGREVAHDGVAFGALHMRGPWVAAGYFGLPETQANARPNWFETGDVVTMDRDGFVQIVDRTKDVMKFGGKWISSIDLENVALSHPAMHEAAVVAGPDARWAERPLLVVVIRPGYNLTREDLLAHFARRVGFSSASKLSSAIWQAEPCSAYAAWRWNESARSTATSA